MNHCNWGLNTRRGRQGALLSHSRVALGGRGATTPAAHAARCDPFGRGGRCGPLCLPEKTGIVDASARGRAVPSALTDSIGRVGESDTCGHVNNPPLTCRTTPRSSRSRRRRPPAAHRHLLSPLRCTWPHLPVRCKHSYGYRHQRSLVPPFLGVPGFTH